MPTGPKAAVLDIAELAQYQEGSVVSRQITKADAGNVTLFAFDAGQELSEHTSPFDALVHILDGEAEVRIAGQPYSLKAGQIIIMPANQPHALCSPGRCRMLLPMIRA